MSRVHPIVGINLLWLVPGTVGGSEESTIRSLLAVSSCARGDFGLRAYVRPELLDTHPELAEALEAVVVPGPLSSKPARVAAENTWLSLASRADDLVHHAGGAVTFTGRGPMIATVHDLQPLDMPENFSWPKRRWLRTLLPLTVRRARRIIVPSQFTASRCVELLGADGQQLVVVPHGYEAGPVGSLPSKLAGIQYLLLPGIAYPHKRHIDALNALIDLRVDYPDLQLVFTGRPAQETPALQQAVADAHLESAVHFLGRVDADVLNALYANAVALVFPSLYEGFGYPALEAMALGCPVIAADGGAVREVVGEAGLLVAQRSPNEIASAVRVLMDDRGRADTFRKRGRAKASEFSYCVNGEAIASVYRDELGLA